MDASLPRERRCGSCTLCCKVMGIVELDKPGGLRCQHQLAGGCGIYGQHPQSCRDFACQWLLNPEIPHRYRPDLCKVVLATDETGERLIAHCDPANPLAWKREPTYSMLRRKAEGAWGTGFCVMAKVGRRVWLLTPVGEQDLGEVDPESPVAIFQRVDGTAAITISPPKRASIEPVADRGAV